MTDKFSPAMAPARQPRTPYTGELTETIAPMPTKRTVRSRTSLPYQAWRFGRVNLRMMKMIRRSHAH
jgi:hypothetical protein